MMTRSERQNLEEIKLAYGSNADIQWLVRQIAAAEARAAAAEQRAEAAEQALREIEQAPYTLAGGTEDILDRVLTVARSAILQAADQRSEGAEGQGAG